MNTQTEDCEPSKLLLEGEAHPDFDCRPVFAFLTPDGSQPPLEQSATPPFVLLNVF